MNAVCLLSGGMDSTTLAYLAADLGYKILGLHFNYGQRTEGKERACAHTIASLLNAEEFLEVDLSYLRKIGQSSLTDHALPVDSYREGREGIPNTYVPFRNANLLAIATSYAEARGADAIFIGVQSQDYSGYPDCRPEFIEAFERTANLATAAAVEGRGTFRIHAPLIHMTKGQIIRTGLALGVDYGLTHSCYDPLPDGRPCGHCDACLLRRAGFAEAGATDPTA